MARLGTGLGTRAEYQGWEPSLSSFCFHAFNPGSTIWSVHASSNPYYSVLCRQSCWKNSLCKDTGINTNCNQPRQTYCQLPTKIYYHRALSLESSAEERCTDPASICFRKSGPSCVFVLVKVILDLEFHIRQEGISSSTPQFPGSKLTRLSSIVPSSSYWLNINRRRMVGQVAYVNLAR
jgi:hypothetical protein